MLYESGALNPAYQAFGRSFKSIPGFLPAKEVGVFSQNQSMTHGQIVSACKGFIVPSSGSPITLARVRDKFFCGKLNVLISNASALPRTWSAGDALCWSKTHKSPEPEGSLVVGPGDYTGFLLTERALHN